MVFLQPVRLAGGWWLVLICSERKVLLAGLFGEESTAGWWLIGQTNRLQLFQQFFHFSFFTLQITPTPSTFPPHIHCIVGPTHHTLQKSS
jgi:hypothetical protein